MRSFVSTVADDHRPRPAITEDLSELSDSDSALQQFSATIPCQNRTIKCESVRPPALPIGQKAKQGEQPHSFAEPSRLILLVSCTHLMLLLITNIK
jgi:hypothetical protein